MEKPKKTPPNKEELVAVPDHTEKIKSQVLAKIGRPPRLDHVEVSDHTTASTVSIFGSGLSRTSTLLDRLVSTLGYPIT